MADFYFVKEPISRLFIKLFNDGKGFIPTDRKGIFLTLFFAIFTTVTGVGIVVPLLPVYANSLGATGLYVGMIFGAFSISRTILLPVFGRLSDYRGRKPFIVAGLLAYTLISIAFIYSENIESLIFLRFVQGAASAMIMPVVQAYIGEITPAGSEGYAMGLFNLSMFLSLSIGPLMGGVIKDIWSLDTAFVCMGVFSATGLLLCFFFLPPVRDENINKVQADPMPWSNLVKEKILILIFLFRYAYTFCIGVIWCFMPVYADTRFGLSGSLTGVLVMLGVFVSGLLQLPMGYLADRVDKKKMVLCGGLFSSIGMALPFYASNFSDLLIAVGVFGVGGGIAMPAIMAWAVIMGDKKKAMGSVMSIMTVAHSLGMLSGSMVAGLAMDYLSLKFSFPCGTLVMGLATFIFLIGMEKKMTAKAKP